MARRTTALDRQMKLNAVQPTIIKSQDRAGMSFEYAEVEFAEVTRNRTAQPNPHTSGIAAVVKMRTEAPGKGLAVVVPTAEASKHKSWLRKAGNAAGVSILIQEAVGTVDGVEMTKITFRATEKIERKRKATAESVTPVVTETVGKAVTGF